MTDSTPATAAPRSRRALRFNPQMVDGDLVYREGAWHVAWFFDADECDSVAAALSAMDTWGPDLREAAERLRQLEANDAD